MVLFLLIIVLIVILNINFTFAYKNVALNHFKLGKYHVFKTNKLFMAKKAKDEKFICENCGIEHIRWVGQCTSCNEWNTVKAFRQSRANPLLPLDPRTARSSGGMKPTGMGMASASTSSSFKYRDIGTSSGTSSSNSISTSSGGWTNLPPNLSGNVIGSNPMIKLKNVDINEATSRVKLWSTELNRVLGGGLVSGSAILLVGEPGIGKSTLLAQLASTVAKSETNKVKANKDNNDDNNNNNNDCEQAQVVYISGEENERQIAARAHRLGLSSSHSNNNHNGDSRRNNDGNNDSNSNSNDDGMYLLCETDADYCVETILGLPQSHPPRLVIVDSVQTMRVAATSTGSTATGSVTHIKEATLRFVQMAKVTGAAVVLIGHVTKAGEVAGPKLLEHMVDTVLTLEGSEYGEYRLLKCMKNRFGSTSEVGVYRMSERGMEDVSNPSDLFTSNALITRGDVGCCAAALLEGTRPLLVEIQCLVSSPSFTKRVVRATDGFPQPRLQLLCAVLEKRLGLDLGHRDVYVNIVGGLRINQPAADVAVAIALTSSALDARVKPGVACIGEIGLSGEIRRCRGINSAIKEAKSLGFTTILAPSTSSSSSDSNVRSEGRYKGRSEDGDDDKEVCVRYVRNAIESALDLEGMNLEEYLSRKRRKNKRTSSEDDGYSYDDSYNADSSSSSSSSYTKRRVKEGGNDKERRYVSRADMIRRSLAIDMGADIDVDDVDDVDDDIETEKIKEEEEEVI